MSSNSFYTIMCMKKRSILILVIGIVAIGVLVVCAILFRSTPLLEEGKHYTIVHAEDWPDGYQSRKELELQGKEAEILSCLSEQSQRRSVTSLSREGDSVQIPDWPRFVLTIACDEGDSFLVLVGEDQSQRCAVGYSAPVYQILEKEALYTSLKHLLVS